MEIRMNDKQTILLVDDNEDDLTMLRIAFKKAEFNVALQEVHEGVEAISYLNGDTIYADRNKFPLPAVVLLDLNMPRKTGFQVLEWVRNQELFKSTSVIILSASMRADDVSRAFDLGATSFLVKPGALEDLVAMIRCLRDWLPLNHFPPMNQAVRR
jgi:DNA-binding response OmpR family regulator